MPRYDYQCISDECKLNAEIAHSINSEPEIKCPACKSIMKRLISRNVMFETPVDVEWEKDPSDLTATSYRKYTEAKKESIGGNMSGFDMRDDETYSEYKSRKLREKGPGFNVAMGQKRFNPDDPKKSEAAQRARRNRNKGRRKQNLARKKLKIPNTKFRSMMGHEESWLGHVRVEVKAGKQVQSLWTKFKAAKQQSDENNSAIGNNKPFIFVAMPDGTSDGMVVMELDKLEETVFALLETWDDYEGE